MKVEANSIEQLIDNSSYSNLIMQLKDIIEDNFDFKPVFVDTSSINMIGYCFINYKNSTYKDNLWPIISIAPQKNYVALYIFLMHDNKYFLEQYEDNFKKSQLGKSCLRIKKLDESNIEIITEIINDAKHQIIAENKCVEFGRK